MKKNFHYLTFFSLFLVVFLQCGSPKQTSEPDIFIHYLGHASFILQFDNGISVLTDHGTSNAWGLDSPIYEIENFIPDVATYSHTVHIDHFRGEMPNNVDFVLTNMDSLRLKGIVIQPMRTSELSLKEEDNTSYLISYKGFTILHLGDAQANARSSRTSRRHPTMSTWKQGTERPVRSQK